MKKIYFYFLLSLVGLFALSSCGDDKEYLSLPVFELGISSDNIKVGDNVVVTLTNKNNPGNLRYNSYSWSCTPEVDGLQSSTPNTNNSFTPLSRGKHTIKVSIDITNFADGKTSDTGKTVIVGETTNTYNSVSTLKTKMTVSRTIIVK